VGIVDALQERLENVEDEIVRLTKLAAQQHDAVQQDNYSRLAEDVQREARELRREIIKQETTPAVSGPAL
jgi:hypothetical protein